MRIACLYLPAFPLQVEVRRRPGLAGQVVGILGSRAGDGLVACSRAAFAAGIRPGMSTSAARALAPQLIVIGGSPAAWRDELGDVAVEVAQLAGGAVDLSEALADGRAGPALYVEVPAGQRSRRFGQRLVRAVRELGYRARVGLAEDRFTAWAAARTGKGDEVAVVPRSRAAAFLAPLPLELLPLAVEVRRLLGAAGVATLGDFAALPPPSVDRRDEGAIDYRALALGRGPAALRPLAARLPAVSRRRGRQLVLAG